MNRRAFLAGLTATAAGLLVPERKLWALDRTMLPRQEGITILGPAYNETPPFDGSLLSFEKEKFIIEPSQLAYWEGFGYLALGNAFYRFDATKDGGVELERVSLR